MTRSPLALASPLSTLETTAIAALEPFVGIAGAVRISHAHPQTVRAWIKRGDLPAVRRVKAGSSKWLIRTRDLLVFLGIEPPAPAPDPSPTHRPRRARRVAATAE
jgi:hypothetical protein